MKNIIQLSLVLIFIINVSSCVLIPVNQSDNKSLLQEYKTDEIVSSGIFYYDKCDCLDKNSILITGKVSRVIEKSTFTAFFSEEYEKRNWTFCIQRNNSKLNKKAVLTITKNSSEYDEYSVDRIDTSNGFIEFPYKITYKNQDTPFEILRIFDGDFYSVIITNEKKRNNIHHIVKDMNQIYYIVDKDLVLASFTGKDYQIYSEEKKENLIEYIAIINGVFAGIRKYEKGFYLF